MNEVRLPTWLVGLLMSSAIAGGGWYLSEIRADIKILTAETAKFTAAIAVLEVRIATNERRIALNEQRHNDRDRSPPPRTLDFLLPPPEQRRPPG